MKIVFKRNILIILILSMTCFTISCSGGLTSKDLLCEYSDFNCSYYVKDEYKKYKYSDYIFDDISNGIYKTSTPNIADYKTGNGILDYDIEKYVNAKMDYAIKVDLIKKYEIKIDNLCAQVHDDYFNQRNSHIYYYDKTTNKSTLLYDGVVTNISYDDEVPVIMFDIQTNKTEEELNNLKGRRMMLSDIIAANSTIDGYMKIILATGKERIKFFMDQRVDNNEFYMGIASPSSIANN